MRFAATLSERTHLPLWEDWGKAELGDGEIPAWDDLPHETGLYRRGRAGTNNVEYACWHYGALRKWAKDACAIPEVELRERLMEASGLHNHQRGITGLPIALRSREGVEIHIERVLRLIGVRRALAYATDVAAPNLDLGAGATREFERLLSLSRRDLSQLAASSAFAERAKCRSPEECFRILLV